MRPPGAGESSCLVRFSGGGNRLKWWVVTGDALPSLLKVKSILGMLLASVMLTMGFVKFDCGAVGGGASGGLTDE